LTPEPTSWPAVNFPAGFALLLMAAFVAALSLLGVATFCVVTFTGSTGTRSPVFPAMVTGLAFGFFIPNAVPTFWSVENGRVKSLASLHPP
jgi:hypothetical protein